MDTPFTIPLGVAENIFHLGLSLPALVSLGLARARDRPAMKVRWRP